MALALAGALAAGSAAADDTVAPAASASASADKTVTTATGLQYLDLAVGHGRAAQSGDTVYVHYTGWLQKANGGKGKKFDSSYDRKEPLSFEIGMGHVIAGWEEGIQGMQVGGARRLTIPAILGYGADGAGQGLIPPNATLIFDVKLVKIRPGVKPESFSDK
ncbi:MAG: FKBP-type peptidyl-prolyl cis-trans isomerase [Burkholderiaceae bacterium]|nr:FKBP-type peptidyl-prolyl cis-trans isomerase [Burkholderiaceae bacterium]